MLRHEHLPQFLDAFRRSRPNDVDGAVGVGVDGFGVDEVDGSRVGHVVQESGGGIDIERSADDDKDVRLLHEADGCLNLGNSLAEPHDERA